MEILKKRFYKNLTRLNDKIIVLPWEDRGDTPNYGKWALNRLDWCININRKPNSHVRKYWNQTLDHRIIALLAINARFEHLPTIATSVCNRDQLSNIVTTTMVQKLCRGGKDTLLKIVKSGIDRQDLCQVNPPQGYKGICFTGGKTLMKAFAVKQKIS